MYIIQLSFESGLTEHRKKALIVSVLGFEQYLPKFCFALVKVLGSPTVIFH